jgi:hypothetical protein
LTAYDCSDSCSCWFLATPLIHCDIPSGRSIHIWVCAKSAPWIHCQWPLLCLPSLKHCLCPVLLLQRGERWISCPDPCWQSQA